ncbi:GntR family transcriptional regulator [Citricoccus zhacaiensis]|uniref:GntR family transcriptional regulator n=1 Tax=Citricoccus zhacaiensis TaxID=489142 RepID=A0ABQ2LXA2_9MICC|nr:GntR family transcriptional regulator [Citricoccus zhacaiensis]GGO43962.1 GntR family transcriptional regulator [Citricoccus zhacaiensis]
MTTATDLSTPELSLAEQAYRALRDRLIMLDIAPGEPLNEGRLVTELGFGRTPLREAMKRLETDHLVTSFPRRGTFATRVDITELAAVSEVRQLLEPLAARKAAANVDPETRAALLQAREGIERLDHATPQRDVMALDLAVHRLVYRTAGNHHLEESLIRLDNLATRIWCVVVDRLPDVAGHIREHLGLLDAILEGDQERAETIAAEHVRHFDAAVRSVI